MFFSFFIILDFKFFSRKKKIELIYKKINKKDV